MCNFTDPVCCEFFSDPVCCSKSVCYRRDIVILEASFLYVSYCIICGCYHLFLSLFLLLCTGSVFMRIPVIPTVCDVFSKYNKSVGPTVNQRNMLSVFAAEEIFLTFSFKGGGLGTDNP